MKKYLILLFFLLTAILYSQNILDLEREHSLEEFQNGIRAFHNTHYELAITYFIKSIGYKSDNYKSRFFLGESYRKAGYIDNALFEWNTLLTMNYEDRSLKNRLTYIYNKRGMLTDIFIDKDFILREDIKGFLDGKETPLFIKPSQITIDRNNHLFVASFLTGSVAEFDPNFNLVRNYNTLNPRLEKPFGVALDSRSNLFVSDFAKDAVYKISRLGVIEKTIGFKGIGEGALLGPKYLLIDDDDSLYVTDTGNKRINKYKNNGEILFSFGNKGNPEETVKNPAGMYFYDNQIYICDRDLNKIFVFDKSGNFIRTFGEEQLDKPYSITRDSLGRFLILCQNRLIAYEEDNSLWYPVDAIGNRLKRGISVITDQENNILLTDFDTSRLMVLSLERHRYSNLFINVERIYSNKFPEVHVAVTIEKDDNTTLTGLNASNISLYENGKFNKTFGLDHTQLKNQTNDILIIIDKKNTMKTYQNDIRSLIDNWYKKVSSGTSFSLISAYADNPVLELENGATRLSMMDAIQFNNYKASNDKGAAIKYGINSMINRFSKKSIIIITDGQESGNDFNLFKINDCIEFARNNDIRIYTVSFGNGNLARTLNFISEKTGGEFYLAYARNDIQNLVSKIEGTPGREIIISYKSKSLSRFGDDPISVYLEVYYGGMKGQASSVYYPSIR